MEETVVIIAGNPEKARGQVCITDESRVQLGGAAHAWYRAASHCLTFKDLNYFQQLECAKWCFQMGEAFRHKTPRPPQSSITWGWGKGWPGQR